MRCNVSQHACARVSRSHAARLAVSRAPPAATRAGASRSRSAARVSGPGDGMRPDGRLSTSQPSVSPLNGAGERPRQRTASRAAAAAPRGSRPSLGAVDRRRGSCRSGSLCTLPGSPARSRTTTGIVSTRHAARDRVGRDPERRERHRGDDVHVAALPRPARARRAERRRRLARPHDPGHEQEHAGPDEQRERDREPPAHRAEFPRARSRRRGPTSSDERQHGSRAPGPARAGRTSRRPRSPRTSRPAPATGSGSCRRPGPSGSTATRCAYATASGTVCEQRDPPAPPQQHRDPDDRSSSRRRHPSTSAPRARRAARASRAGRPDRRDRRAATATSPNTSAPTNVIWNAMRMFSAPAPKNTNTPAMSVAIHGRTPARRMTTRSSARGHEVQHDHEQLVRHVGADAEHAPQQPVREDRQRRSSAGSARRNRSPTLPPVRPARKSQSSAQNHHLWPHDSSSGIAASSTTTNATNAARAPPSRRSRPETRHAA